MPSYNSKEKYKTETGQTRLEELKNPVSIFDIIIKHAKDIFSKKDDTLFSHFIGKSSLVTTDWNKELSGGEKAEYLLIEKLQNYDNYDIVLIKDFSFLTPFALPRC